KKLISLLLLTCTTIIYSQDIVDLENFYTDSPENSKFKHYKDIQNKFIPFIGTWRSTTGNVTFILTLWKESHVPFPNAQNPKFQIDELRGHFKLIENYQTSSETIIFSSETGVGGTSPTGWPGVLFSSPIQTQMASGTIYDISAPPNTQIPRRNFVLTINPGNSPVTAEWNVSSSGTFQIENQPLTYSIP